MSRGFAIALDIGTTTLDGCLVEMGGGRELARMRVVNEQISYGDNLISRIHRALKGEKEYQKLRTALIDSANRLIGLLLESAGVRAEEISEVCMVGNAVMYSFTMGYPVESFSRIPFGPASYGMAEKLSSEVGFEVIGDARARFLPNLGGFVGSDALAVILATGLHKSNTPKAAIDIGTNGEVIAGFKDNIWVASTAAGPAFEGWHISCGMPALSGAIESARPNGDSFSIDTVGGDNPSGICGSGLIDIFAGLMEMGHLDKTGRLQNGEFTILQEGEKRIFLNQEDVRQMQHAKAAIRTALDMLFKAAGIKAANIDGLYLTGTFGNRISSSNAQKIGLIPDAILTEKISVVQDAALEGAKEILINKSALEEAISLSKRIKHVELSCQKAFQDNFVNAMHF
ncbi:MAG: DUF4445 domain-containing protein [Candidatus Omnitrophica bacterium]|nr:DUF4445 domain-containing protein [Candidatus Omnitrophota bacterium]